MSKPLQFYRRIRLAKIRVQKSRSKTAENSKPVANPETNDPVLAANKTHENTSRDQSIQGN